MEAYIDAVLDADALPDWSPLRGGVQAWDVLVVANEDLPRGCRRKDDSSDEPPFHPLWNDPMAAPDPVVSIGEFDFNVSRQELRRDDAIIRLTTIEANLLTILARNPGATMTRDELIAQCRIDGGARTVDVQVTRLRRKIEPDPREPRFLLTVRGQGYVLHPD